PDPIMSQQFTAFGAGYNFWFVDQFGRGQTKKRGSRGSYALNVIVHGNFAEDRFPDASRQVYAADGWWTWFGSISATYVLRSSGFSSAAPLSALPEGSSRVAWRHGKSQIGQFLFRDGHVGSVTPQVPPIAAPITTATQNLMLRTVDTNKLFTWLPME